MTAPQRAACKPSANRTRRKSINARNVQGAATLLSPLHRCLPLLPIAWERDAITPIVHAAAHLCNCARRRSLRGATAVLTCHGLPPARFIPRQRHATFLWMKERSADILARVPLPSRHDTATAWRTSVRQWLQSRKLITIHTNPPTQNNQPVLPYSNPLSCS